MSYKLSHHDLITCSAHHAVVTAKDIVVEDAADIAVGHELDSDGHGLDEPVLAEDVLASVLASVLAFGLATHTLVEDTSAAHMDSSAEEFGGSFAEERIEVPFVEVPFVGALVEEHPFEPERPCTAGPDEAPEACRHTPWCRSPTWVA